MTTDPSPATSPKAAAEHGLQRQMGLSDLVLAQVLCVVGSSWVGVAAVLGRAQALTWMAAMLLFYFPMAAVVVVLNRRPNLHFRELRLEPIERVQRLARRHFVRMKRGKHRD